MKLEFFSLKFLDKIYQVMVKSDFSFVYYDPIILLRLPFFN